MMSPLQRLSYVARQGARVAWYMGHYFATQEFRRAGRKDDRQGLDRFDRARQEYREEQG